MSFCAQEKIIKNAIWTLLSSLRLKRNKKSLPQFPILQNPAFLPPFLASFFWGGNNCSEITNIVNGRVAEHTFTPIRSCWDKDTQGEEEVRKEDSSIDHSESHVILEPSRTVQPLK